MAATRFSAVGTIGPSTAERVRSACARASSAVLAIEGADPVPTSVHHLHSRGVTRPGQPAAGQVSVVVPDSSVATALAWQSSPGGLPAVLELTDHSPLTLREPVRSLVWLRGTLHPVPVDRLRHLAGTVAAEHPHPGLLDVGYGATLLRLELDSAVVADSDGAEPVPIDELLRARPDPFWEMEACWLQHLDGAHSDLVDLLSRRLPWALRQGRIRPLGIDRYGVRLRVEGAAGDQDVRMSFAEPVDDAAALSRALRVLVGCPYLNGLRARS